MSSHLARCWTRARRLKRGPRQRGQQRSDRPGLRRRAGRGRAGGGKLLAPAAAGSSRCSWPRRSATTRSAPRWAACARRRSPSPAMAARSSSSTNERAAAMSEVILEPGRVDRNYWLDLWRYRELFQVLAWRDVAIRYKQTAIGKACRLGGDPAGPDGADLHRRSLAASPSCRARAFPTRCWCSPGCCRGPSSQPPSPTPPQRPWSATPTSSARSISPG